MTSKEELSLCANQEDASAERIDYLRSQLCQDGQSFFS